MTSDPEEQLLRDLLKEHSSPFFTPTPQERRELRARLRSIKEARR